MTYQFGINMYMIICQHSHQFKQRDNCVNICLRGSSKRNWWPRSLYPVKQQTSSISALSINWPNLRRRKRFSARAARCHEFILFVPMQLSSSSCLMPRLSLRCTFSPQCVCYRKFNHDKHTLSLRWPFNLLIIMDDKFIPLTSSDRSIHKKFLFAFFSISFLFS